MNLLVSYQLGWWGTSDVCHGNGSKKRPFPHTGARTAVSDFCLLISAFNYLPVNRLSFHIMGCFHQRFAERGMGVYIMGDFLSSEFLIVRQG